MNAITVCQYANETNKTKTRRNANKIAEQISLTNVITGQTKHRHHVDLFINDIHTEN